MGTLYENLSALCAEKGVSRNQMCVEAGVSRNIMTELSKGRRVGLTNKNIEKLAKYFEVTEDVILHGKKEKPTTVEDDELSETKKAAIELVKSLDDSRIEAILKLLGR